MHLWWVRFPSVPLNEDEIMDYLNYIHPKDIAYRIIRRGHMIWSRIPTIVLNGAEGEFGTLSLDFGNDEGEEEWRVYIKDRQKILDTVNYTIENFSDIVTEMYHDSD